MMRQREMMARLEQIMRALSGEDRQSLLAFAEFLHARSAELRTEVAAPVIIPRPEGETVVAAIKFVVYSQSLYGWKLFLESHLNLIKID